MCSGARAVDQIDERGERRALAAAGGAGHEHQAARFLATSSMTDGGSPSALERRNLVRDQTHRHRDRAALAEHAGADSGRRRAPATRRRLRGWSEQPLLVRGRQQPRRDRLEVGGADGRDRGPPLSEPLMRTSGAWPARRWMSEAPRPPPCGSSDRRSWRTLRYCGRPRRPDRGPRRRRQKPSERADTPGLGPSELRVDDRSRECPG